VHQETLAVTTRAAGLSNITAEVSAVVQRSRIATGLCTVFVQHTSASLVIQENADPAVLRDLSRFMADLVPESRAWEHDDEGHSFRCRCPGVGGRLDQLPRFAEEEIVRAEGGDSDELYQHLSTGSYDLVVLVGTEAPAACL